MNYRLSTYLVVVLVFLASCLVPILGLLGVVHIESGLLKWLAGGLLLDSAVCIYALFKKSDFLGADSTSNLRPESWRALATFWHFQQRYDDTNPWCLAIHPATPSFRTFLRAVAQLHSLELVSVSHPGWMVGLTTEGIHFCRANHKKLSKITDHFFIEPKADKEPPKQLEQ